MADLAPLWWSLAVAASCGVAVVVGQLLRRRSADYPPAPQAEPLDDLDTFPERLRRLGATREDAQALTLLFACGVSAAAVRALGKQYAQGKPIILVGGEVAYVDDPCLVFARPVGVSGPLDTTTSLEFRLFGRAWTAQPTHLHRTRRYPLPRRSS